VTDDEILVAAGEIIKKRKAAVEPEPPPAPQAQPTGEDLERILAGQADAEKARKAEIRHLRDLSKREPSEDRQPAPQLRTGWTAVGGPLARWTCTECASGIWGNVHFPGGGAVTLCDRCNARHELHCDGCGKDAERVGVTKWCSDHEWRCEACAEAWLALPDAERPRRMAPVIGLRA
jgi:hypothetical protein